MAASNDKSVVCSRCGKSFASYKLEEHIAADHLEYFPYGCAYCPNWMPTQELAVFHAERRQHVPIKINEHLQQSTERRLRDMMATSKPEREGMNRQRNSSQGSSGNATRFVETIPRRASKTMVNSRLLGGQKKGAPVGSRLSVAAPRTKTSTDSKAAIRLQRRRVCNLCRASFWKTEKQRKHVNKHMLAFECVHCTYKAKLEKTVRGHVTSKHPDKPANSGVSRVAGYVDVNLSTMYKKCFGPVFEPQQSESGVRVSAADICTSTGVPRINATRAVKSIRACIPKTNAQTDSTSDQASSDFLPLITTGMVSEVQVSVSVESTAPDDAYMPSAEENPLDLTVGEVCWARWGKNNNFWPACIYSFNSGGEVCVQWLGTKQHSFRDIGTLEHFRDTYDQRYKPKKKTVGRSLYETAVAQAIRMSCRGTKGLSSEFDVMGDESQEHLKNVFEKLFSGPES